jgi:hypothetical protein
MPGSWFASILAARASCRLSAAVVAAVPSPRPPVPPDPRPRTVPACWGLTVTWWASSPPAAAAPSRPPTRPPAAGRGSRRGGWAIDGLAPVPALAIDRDLATPTVLSEGWARSGPAAIAGGILGSAGRGVANNSQVQPTAYSGVLGWGSRILLNGAGPPLVVAQSLAICPSPGPPSWRALRASAGRPPPKPPTGPPPCCPAGGGSALGQMDTTRGPPYAPRRRVSPNLRRITQSKFVINSSSISRSWELRLISRRFGIGCSV